VTVKLGQDLASIDQGDGEEQVSNIGGDGMENTRQRYNLGYFRFTGHRCVEKIMIGFRIHGCTIKRGKLVCISVI